MRRLISGALLAVGIAFLANAPAGAQEEKKTKIKKDRYVITIEEIQERPDITNGMEAVRMLRSQWLRSARSKGSFGAAAYGNRSYRPAAKNTGSEDNPRGEQDATSQAANSQRDAMMDADANRKGGPVLYIDEVKQESVDELQNIRVAEIAEIRYMSGNDASGRYGAGHESGAILLKTNRLKP